MELWAYRSSKSEKSVPAFLQGIQANAGTLDMDQLRAAGWEEDVFVLGLCAAVLEGEEWMKQALPEYIEEDVQGNGEEGSAEQDLLNHASSLMDIVRTAAGTASEGSVWTYDTWSPGFIAWIGKMLLYDSMTMMIPDGENGREEARLVVYLHSRVDGNQ